MYKDLRKKAEKKVKAKLTFYTVAIVFSFSTIILFMLRFYLPAIGFWLMLPIPAFFMVLGVLYLSAFGVPFTRTSSEDWEADEIEKEMIKRYRQEKGRLRPEADLSATEVLELKELEHLQQKQTREEDFV